VLRYNEIRKYEAFVKTLLLKENALLLHLNLKGFDPEYKDKLIYMATNRTFTMLKPDAVKNGHIGAILEKITASGFRIVAMKLTQMTKADAEEFYGIHRERPFFGELVEYMTSGPIVAAILEKDNAVEDFRTLIGATNPAEAAEGTIRKMYAKSIGENAIHGSDSDENAAIEGAFHFSGREMF
jgi:nucleoside-diphosphate kinase